MTGIIVSILALMLLSFYALNQWRKCANKWLAAEKRCIELECEVRELEYRSSR